MLFHSGLIYLCIIQLISRVNSEESQPDLQCGVYCCYIALKAQDFPVGRFHDFQRRIDLPASLGYSMEQLRAHCESYGAVAKCIRTDLDSLSTVKDRFVAVLLLTTGHYVVYQSDNANFITTIDPPDVTKTPKQSFASLWHGEAIIISRENINAFDVRDRFDYKALVVLVVLSLGLIGATISILKKRRQLNANITIPANLS